MSERVAYKRLTRELVTRARRGGTLKVVLLVAGYGARGTGQIGLRSLAAEARLAVGTVREAIEEAVTEGWLEVTGLKNTAEYRLAASYLKSVSKTDTTSDNKRTGNVSEIDTLSGAVVEAAETVSKVVSVSDTNPLTPEASPPVVSRAARVSVSKPSPEELKTPDTNGKKKTKKETPPPPAAPSPAIELSPVEFALYTLIVSQRWRLDTVPPSQVPKAMHAARWLVAERAATAERGHQFVSRWWTDPDLPGARRNSRPWPTQWVSEWDTAFNERPAARVATGTNGNGARASPATVLEGAQASVAAFKAMAARIREREDENVIDAETGTR